MGRPPQQVDVFSVQDRRKDGKTKPWTVRWRVEGRQRTRAFRTRGEVDRFKALLVQAVSAGERFDERTCEPASWSEQAEARTLSVYDWARRWLAEQWPEWQPRTRRSAVEALTRFLPLVVDERAPAPPKSIRSFLTVALEPGPSRPPTTRTSVGSLSTA